MRSACGCVSLGTTLLAIAPLAALAQTGGGDTGTNSLRAAERITLRVDVGTDGVATFQILSRASTRKALPPSDELGQGPLSGFWYELQANGEVLYRRIIGNPIRRQFEGPDPNNGSEPDLIDTIPATQAITLLIPQSGPGHQLVLFSSPLEPGAQAEEAVEVARIDLTIIPLPGPPTAPADGMVIGATKIVDNGPDASRWTVVLLAEGYQDAELPSFAAHAQQFADFLLNTPPFSTNCSAINVWRVDISSTDSGADDPASPPDDPMTPEDESTYCGGGTGAMVDTYFDATFCGDGKIRRLLTANKPNAVAVLDAQVPNWDASLIVVNSQIYGGAGGVPGTTSLSGTWENIAIHEIGHSAFGLADEYEYWAGCSSGEIDRDNHPGPEPSQPNVTIETDPNLIKWKSLIAGSTAIPTTMNADCSACDSQGNPFPGQFVVGLYEGAHYYHCDAYRPVFSCMMRNFADFCPVCTARILSDLEPFQPPNTPPNCDADGPYVEECTGATTPVTLDASGSTDMDCDTLGFAWTGPFVGGATIGIMPTVEFNGLGMFTVDLLVSDGTDTDMCSSAVVITDNTPPVITCPADVTLECPADTSVAANGTATATDICDGAPAIDNTDAVMLMCGLTRTVERTWTATDASGNTDECVQTITEVDTTPPVVTCPLDITVDRGDKICDTVVQDWLDSGMVTDTCSTNAMIVEDSASNGFACGFPFGSETTVTWTGTDDCGNTATCDAVITVRRAPKVELGTKGSMLIFPKVELRWNDAGELVQDTFIKLSNDYNLGPDVIVKLFFVNGDDPVWDFADATMRLTPDQPAYWSTDEGRTLSNSGLTFRSTGDPIPDPQGSSDLVMRGYIIAYATNLGGLPLRWNHLSGEATLVNYAEGTAWSYIAYAAASTCPAATGDLNLACDMVDSNGVCCSVSTNGCLLGLDGVQYNQPPNELVFNFTAVGAELASGDAGPFVAVTTDLTLLPVNIDLKGEDGIPGVATATQARFVIFNENENKKTNTRKCVTCWDQSLLSSYGDPNWFRQAVLGTDAGKASVNGEASLDCDVDFAPNDGKELGEDYRDLVSQDTALLGVIARYLDFGFGDVDCAGYSLTGRGCEPALIRVPAHGDGGPTSESPDGEIVDPFDWVDPQALPDAVVRPALQDGASAGSGRIE